MRRLKFRAILLGVLTDLGAFLVLGVIVWLAWVVLEIVQGRFQSILASLTPSAQGIFIFGLVVGLPCTALAGFVAGRAARADYALHGAVVGAVSVIFGWVCDSGTISLWLGLSSWLLAIPAAIGGALLAKPRSSS
jgi:hypothetical protein